MSRIAKAFVLLLGLVLLTVGVAARAMAADAATLCGASEKVVFSCSNGQKTVSICAAPPKATPNSSLHYRFGTPGKVELSFPSAERKASDAFLSGSLTYSGGGGALLRFESGAYQYTVFDAIGKWGRHEEPLELAGVVITKGGGPVATVQCRGKARSELGPELFDRLELKSIDLGDFEIPKTFFPK
jgi:hypothetical protein